MSLDERLRACVDAACSLENARKGILSIFEEVEQTLGEHSFCEAVSIQEKKYLAYGLMMTFNTGKWKILMVGEEGFTYDIHAATVEDLIRLAPLLEPLLQKATQETTGKLLRLRRWLVR